MLSKWRDTFPPAVMNGTLTDSPSLSVILKDPGCAKHARVQFSPDPTILASRGDHPALRARAQSICIELKAYSWLYIPCIRKRFGL